MLLLSWNVAGWSTTVNRIHDNYAVKAKSPSASSPIAEYFRRHGDPMIVCLQEHKIPYQQLSSRSEPRQLATVPGYESFWSCNVDPEIKKGLNGTVTYAKTGSVLRADAAPLRDPSLDQQGRCIMTDHGDFVVFNVYVPNSGGHPMAMKMKFLNALRRAMKREREENGKMVILVGDLNISHKAIDIHWKDRTVHIQQILDDVEAASAAELKTMPKWRLDIAKHWQNIEEILETREAVQTKTTNSRTRETYTKYRLKITVDDRAVFLGKHESCPEYCVYPYDFHAAYYLDEETGEQVMTRENRSMFVERLAELMLKVANIEWSLGIQREIASKEASEPRVSPKRRWLTELLEQDGMVDAFRHFFPYAEARFTCWNQFTNGRYTNEGARIDYTLIDEGLLSKLLKGDDLRCGMFATKTSTCPSEASQIQKNTSTDSTGRPDVLSKPLPPSKGEGESTTDTLTENALPNGSAISPNEKDPSSEEMALHAATAGGCFKPVSFEGGGIIEASQKCLDTQFGAPATGMVYTPPSFSDHIGVSLLLDQQVEQNNLVLRSDAATRKSQPHKSQRTIASFFGASQNETKSLMSKKSSLKRTIVKKPETNNSSSNNFFETFKSAPPKSTSSSNGVRATKRSLGSFKSGGKSSSKQRRTEEDSNGQSTLLSHFKKQEK